MTFLHVAVIKSGSCHSVCQCMVLLSVINIISFLIKGVDCGTPQTVINANPVFSTTLYGDTVTYACSLGYELVDNGILTCGSDRNWAGVTPACQGRILFVTDQVTVIK